jgi:N,N'-diacetyllegionaminate synthase
MIKSVLIIAEAGVNHNGDIQLAKRLIEVAANAGADYVKFQTFKAENLVTKYAEKAAYQANNSGKAETQFEMLKKLELTTEDHKALIEHCDRCGIKFLSTGFDIDSITLLKDFGIEIYKIPSGEITNLPYLRYIGQQGGEIILSTGMSNLKEVSAALDVLEKSGTPREKITVLHCTTEYPAPIDEVNLSAMTTMKKELGIQVGYSDHTKGIEVAIAAAALGANVIEKHFTLDQNLPGPDHMASLDPKELTDMVSAIRNIERALGNGIKIESESERSNKIVARKSLVAKKAIKKNELFSADNIVAKRPGTGLSPMKWDNVVGTKASRNFKIDEQIEL